MESVGPPSGTLYILGYTFKQITESVGLPSGTLYQGYPLNYHKSVRPLYTRLHFQIDHGVSRTTIWYPLYTRLYF